MATVVNNPADTGHSHESDSGMGFVIGVILLVVFALLLIFYGLPLLRGNTTQPQFNIPGRVDVNLNQGQGGAR
jgi:hypothetical protein